MESVLKTSIHQKVVGLLYLTYENRDHEFMVCENGQVLPMRDGSKVNQFATMLAEKL